MTLTNIAIIGAAGNLGPHVLTALQNSPSNLTITMLARQSSKSTYPSSPNTAIHHIPDSPTHADLVKALKGQHVLVMAYGHVPSADQIAMIDAAAEAGVQRVIPADYGSVDSSSERACKLVPLYVEKAKVRKHLQDLASKSAGKFSWTSLVCGHFFDYGLECGLLQFFPKEKRAGIFDGGEIKASASTLPQIGKAVVGIIAKPEETRDRMLYMQSFCVTQNQVFEALEKAAGSKWRREELDSEEFTEKWRKVLEEKPKDHEATEELVSVLGVLDADWTGYEDFAMSVLGLEEESLEEVVKGVIKKLGL